MNANKRKILEDAGILYTSVVTNADRIRAMSDEELAEFMERTKFYVCKKVAEICGIYNLEEHWDKDGIVKEEIEWLKQEACT